jgi:hypothetical protein
MPQYQQEFHYDGCQACDTETQTLCSDCLCCRNCCECDGERGREDAEDFDRTEWADLLPPMDLP